MGPRAVARRWLRPSRVVWNASWPAHDVAFTLASCILPLPRPVRREGVVHEMSIVDALLQQVQEEVEKSGHAGRVLGLHLIVGRLSGVHVDSVRFAFEILAPGTIAEDAEVKIDQPQAELVCNVCGACNAIDELTISCPDCGSSNVSIRGGQDLLLQSIELED